MTQNKSYQGNILIVDDGPANLKILMTMLSSQGYQVRPAISGTLALTASRENPPDLILLDVSMPEMDGYEVCRRLKADEITRDIPVIFISARGEVEDKVKAFTTGGVDYITKPFQIEEVLARIETHLTIRNLQKNLQEQVAELDAFARTVAHDLKNPLGVIISYTDYLITSYQMMGEHEQLEMIRNSRKAVHKAVNIVNELLLLAGVRKKENVEMIPVDMAEVIRVVMERMFLLKEQYEGEFILPDSWPVAMGYAPWIEEVWVNYISNGLKYGGRPPTIELGATPQPDEDKIRFWVRDNGPGLTPKEQASLFTEFTRIDKLRAQGHGLGLSIVRRIMDKLEGQVGVDSDVDGGSLFYFTLPITSKQEIS